MRATEVYTQRPKVSKQVAIREVRKHGASVQEFLQDLGDRAEYDGWQVLEWLGY